MIRHFSLPYQNIVRQIRTVSYISFNNKKVNAISLWDTGASCSSISYDIVKALGLAPISKIPVLTPSSPKPELKDVYIVDIELPNKIIIKDVNVCSSEIGNQNIQLLVGMDIITRGDFAISNNGGRTTFSFRYPSYKEINFVNEARMDDISRKCTHGKGKRKK